MGTEGVCVGLVTQTCHESCVNTFRPQYTTYGVPMAIYRPQLSLSQRRGSSSIRPPLNYTGFSSAPAFHSGRPTVPPSEKTGKGRDTRGVTTLSSRTRGCKEDKGKSTSSLTLLGIPQTIPRPTETDDPPVRETR